jgi:hypothetical protein
MLNRGVATAAYNIRTLVISFAKLIQEGEDMRSLADHCGQNLRYLDPDNLAAR